MRAFTLSFLLVASLTIRAQFFAWSQLPPFPGTARDDASAFVMGGKVYVGTGREVGFALTSDWYVYDVENTSWDTIAALPASGRQYCSTFSDGFYGYLFGGVDASGQLNELWRYDPALDVWQQRASLPAAGRYATVAFDDGLICTGLLNGGAPTNECWQYSIADDSWQQRTSMPGVPRHRACGSGASYRVMGGSDADGVALADGYVYDLGTDTWSAAIALPDARIGADAVHDPLFDISYVVGGASSATEFHDDAWESTADDWSALPAFSGGPRRGAVMAFVEGPSTATIRHIFYGTGVDATQRYGDWWVYTILMESIGERSRAHVPAYPNPTTGTVRFKIDGNATLSYRVNDAYGRTVSTGVPLSGKVDLSHLVSGHYVIELTHGADRYRSHITLLRP